jgi:hypothetical protein
VGRVAARATTASASSGNRAAHARSPPPKPRPPSYPARSGRQAAQAVPWATGVASSLAASQPPRRGPRSPSPGHRPGEWNDVHRAIGPTGQPFAETGWERLGRQAVWINRAPQGGALGWANGWAFGPRYSYVIHPPPPDAAQMAQKPALIPSGVCGIRNVYIRMDAPAVRTHIALWKFTRDPRPCGRGHVRTIAPEPADAMGLTPCPNYRSNTYRLWGC